MISRRKSVAFQLPSDPPRGQKVKDKEEKGVSIWTIISTGNAEGLRQYIKTNGAASLNKRSGNFRSPLGLAVYLENPELVQIMLECDPRPDVNIIDKNGNTPLHEAVERGYLQITKQLLNTGMCNLELKTPHNYTPLMRSVYNDYEEIAEALITAGANIEATGAKGRTSLFIAVIESSLNCMELLLKNGCNMAVRDSHGFTMLKTIFKTNSIIKAEAIKLLQKFEYNIDHDRDYLEDMVKKSKDPNDKVYAEMLLQNKSIKEACENPFASGGWHRRNSLATRRISVISEISLSFIYGKQLSLTEVD
ncbi:E3 ubiquitin-protein ligase MIB1-like [Saccostrea echinata]|uniref:E3 ubiquitin-protein ligase MIB1-like n=1 Tax=Saccostrea echinata TaxID=191078 RepID=UPI002A7F370B|nr:E3 ubiquitin-protein ligase MIB1-like [Saccostrea echinata]